MKVLIYKILFWVIVNELYKLWNLKFEQSLYGDLGKFISGGIVDKESAC